MDNTTNTKFAPPEGLEVGELFTIGNALINKLVTELRSVATLRSWMEDPERRSTIGYHPTHAEIEEVVAREIERCRRIYDLVCKWVPVPAEWEFYLHWLEKPL